MEPAEPSGRPPHTVAAPSDRIPARLYAVLGIVFVFSLGNSADAFLLLRLADALGSATFVPLLWSALHVIKASLSTWGGALSDRIGRKQVIAMGWGIYALVYLGFATSASGPAFVAWFLVYGVYFALAEGAEKALVADLAPRERHGTAFGIYNAILGAGTLTASIAFGVVYQRFGPATAFAMGAGLAAVAAALLVTTPAIQRPGAQGPAAP